MSAYQKLFKRLQNGEKVLIDGATGSEIERRGVDTMKFGWSGGAALTHPDVVRGIHEDYIRTGAEVVIANTFSTSRHVLADAGNVDNFEALNRRAVELALEARENMNAPDVVVAASVSYWSFTKVFPSHEQLRQNVRDQVEIFVEAGAELLMLEMMADVDRALILLEEAQASGLPVWMGFSARIENGILKFFEGEQLFEDGILAIKDKNVPVVNVMHTQTDYIDACLDVMQTHLDGVLGVYAHLGKFIEPDWMYDDTILPSDYASLAKGWLDRGVQVIGGCCGIGADHIGAIKPLV